MHKVGFYCDMSGLEGKDVSSILDGNPGIGGTQYLFLLVTMALNEGLTDEEGKISLFVKGKFICDSVKTSLIEVQSLEECIRVCKKSGYDILVLREHEVLVNERLLDEAKMNVVVWMHNTATMKLKRLAAKKDYIRRMVCVSDRQYENMRKARCFGKCIAINNAFSDVFFTGGEGAHSEPSVVYVGALVPQKGVQDLIDIWRHVQCHNSQARLIVVGGAGLRNTRQRLGSMGIAKPNFERLIIRKMKRIDHANIEFKGVLPWPEIKGILQNAQVGVVNPSHVMRDETFCLSAIEMASQGLPVVSRWRKDGLGSTIVNGRTGFLERSNRRIAGRILQLLDDNEERAQMGEEATAFASGFNTSRSAEKWRKLFREIDEPTQKAGWPGFDFYENFVILSDRVKLAWYKILGY